VAKSERAIDDIIESIKKGEKGNFITKSKSSLTKALSDKAFHLARATKNFFLDDGCTGCGLCAEQCPDKAIDIVDGKPVWLKERCEICFRCIHHCPAFAIQYGQGKTRDHGQYTNPHTKI
jgi:MinD superfamily P-loop ATPase